MMCRLLVLVSLFNRRCGIAGKESLFRFFELYDERVEGSERGLDQVSSRLWRSMLL